MSQKLNIGLFGFGCVGGGLYEVLNQSQLLDATISKIVVKSPNKVRSIPEENFSYDKNVILQDASINVVVELINDTDEALDIVKTALLNGKHVVTANKKLVAEHFEELTELAKEKNVSLLYEAAVAAAIPIIRNLEEYYNNDMLTSLEGIVNGTTNYILSQLDKGETYESALKAAQELGFAELNPTMDVDGFDSKFKLAILIKHAFGVHADPKKVTNFGIRNIKKQDSKYATEKGFKIKLISKALKINNSVIGFVAPHFVPRAHSLHQVDQEFNGVIVEGAFADKQLFYGKGAGSFPTASAVLSDVSALKFDYQYEYKKSEQANGIGFSNDFYVKIYLGSEFISLINEVPFLRVDEVFQSKDYNYQVGWVHFKELEKFDLNKIKDLSLVVLPDAILGPNNINQLKAEQEAFAVEY